MKSALAAAMVVGLIATGTAKAEEVVHFKNGQAMRVEKTRQDGRWLYMTLASEQEMGVLLRQIKQVEPAEILPGAVKDTSVSANLVSGGGPGVGGGYVAPAVAESYDAAELAGEEPQSVQQLPGDLQQQQQNAAQGAMPPQGQDLVPSQRRRPRTR